MGDNLYTALKELKSDINTISLITSRKEEENEFIGKSITSLEKEEGILQVKVQEVELINHAAETNYNLALMKFKKHQREMDEIKLEIYGYDERIENSFNELDKTQMFYENMYSKYEQLEQNNMEILMTIPIVQKIEDLKLKYEQKSKEIEKQINLNDSINSQVLDQLTNKEEQWKEFQKLCIKFAEKYVEHCKNRKAIESFQDQDKFQNSNSRNISASPIRFSKVSQMGFSRDQRVRSPTQFSNIYRNNIHKLPPKSMVFPTYRGNLIGPIRPQPIVNATATRYHRQNSSFSPSRPKESTLAVVSDPSTTTITVNVNVNSGMEIDVSNEKRNEIPLITIDSPPFCFSQKSYTPVAPIPEAIVRPTPAVNDSQKNIENENEKDVIEKEKTVEIETVDVGQFDKNQNIEFEKNANLSQTAPSITDEHFIEPSSVSSSNMMITPTTPFDFFHNSTTATKAGFPNFLNMFGESFGQTTNNSGNEAGNAGGFLDNIFGWSPHSSKNDSLF